VLATLRKRLAALLEQRKALATERDQIASVTETRDATPEELAAFDEKRGAIKTIDDEVATLTSRITDLEADEKREQAAAAAYAQAGQTGQRREGGARVISEPTAYGREQRHSYFLDLARDQLGRGEGDGGVQAARERLRRHAQELAVEMPIRETNRRAAAQRALEGIEGLRPEQRASVFERGLEQRVNPNRTDGTGGFHEMAAAAA
jgi:hypothetical protein